MSSSFVLESADHRDTWALTDLQVSRLPELAKLRDMCMCSECSPCANIKWLLNAGMLGATVVEYASCSDPGDFALSCNPEVAAMQLYTLDFLGVDRDTLRTPAQLREEVQQLREEVQQLHACDYVAFDVVDVGVGVDGADIWTRTRYVPRDFDFSIMARWDETEGPWVGIKTMEDLVACFRVEGKYMHEYFDGMEECDEKARTEILAAGGTLHRARGVISGVYRLIVGNTIHYSEDLPGIRVYRQVSRITCTL